MPSLKDRLRMLTRLGAPAAEATLIAAVPHADPRELPAMSRALLAQGRPAGLAVLLRHYGDLVPEVRRELDRVPAELLLPAFREVLSSGSDPCVLAALGAIQNLQRAEFAHLTVEWLQAKQEAIAQAAAQALLTVARVEPTDPATFRRLDRALAPALRSYETHRGERALLAAALQLPHPGPELEAVLADEQQAALMPLRGLIRRSDDEQLRLRLLSLLLFEQVRGAVRQRLTAPIGPADHEAFLSQAHLACVPAIRAELRQLERSLRALPDPGQNASLSLQAQTGYPRFLAALGLAEKVRTDRLADAVTFASPLSRLLSLAALLARDTTEADGAIVHFCFDREPAIASLATRYLLRRLPGVKRALPQEGALQTGASPVSPVNKPQVLDSLRAMRQLRRSEHECVRRLIVGTPAGPDTTFELAWDLAQKGRPMSALIMARQALKRDHKPVIESLRRRVVNGSREERLRAILLARQLGLLDRTELELLACLTGEDTRVAATAVSALGEVESPASAEALAACLSHADARVQANAIEAIDRRLPWRGAVDALVRCLAPIEPLADCAENRPRANALRTLLRAGCAEPGRVARLLRDERPLHRVSGMWLVGKLGLTEVREELEALAQRERAPAMQRRAEVVVRRLAAVPQTAVPIAAAPGGGSSL